VSPKPQNFFGTLLDFADGSHVKKSKQDRNETNPKELVFDDLGLRSGLGLRFGLLTRGLGKWVKSGESTKLSQYKRSTQQH
jgi:hypothetical protein